MNQYEQAFAIGFVKRAQSYGYTEEHAHELLKQAFPNLGGLFKSFAKPAAPLQRIGSQVSSYMPREGMSSQPMIRPLPKVNAQGFRGDLKGFQDPTIEPELQGLSSAPKPQLRSSPGILNRPGVQGALGRPPNILATQKIAPPSPSAVELMQQRAAKWRQVANGLNEPADQPAPAEAMFHPSRAPGIPTLSRPPSDLRRLAPNWPSWMTQNQKLPNS